MITEKDRSKILRDITNKINRESGVDSLKFSPTTNVIYIFDSILYHGFLDDELSTFKSEDDYRDHVMFILKQGITEVKADVKKLLDFFQKTT